MTRRKIQGARSIVTGASSGIGREIALELARYGARVVLTSRREDRLQRLGNEIKGRGGEAYSVAGDITDAVLRRRLLETAESQLGGLDLLVNNAGIGAIGPFAQADESRLRQVMEVNFFAPAELMRGALPLLKMGIRPIFMYIWIFPTVP